MSLQVLSSLTCAVIKNKKTLISCIVQISSCVWRCINALTVGIDGGNGETMYMVFYGVSATIFTNTN